MIEAYTQMDHVDDLSGNAIDVWLAWGSLMASCWHHDPAQRPAIADLHGELLMLFATHQRSLPALRDVGALVAASTKAAGSK